MSRRRRFLAALGGGLSLAGCLRLEGGEGTTVERTTGTAGPSPSSTAAPTTEAPTEEPTDEPTEGDPEPVTALSGTWEQFRGDARNTGVSGEASGFSGEPAETWRAPAGNHTLLNSSPVVADGLAYVEVDTGILRAYDTADGSVAWEQPYPDGDAEGLGSVAVRDGLVYGGPIDDDVFYAFDAASGAYQWRASLSTGTFASPTVAGDAVYVASTDGVVYALDAEDGGERWRYDTGGETVLGTPAVTDGSVYVASTTPQERPDGVSDLVDEYFYYDQFYQWGDLEEDPLATVVDLDASGTVHAVDAATGDVRWSTTLPDFVVSSPAVVNGTVYVGCWDGNVYALDGANGSERWRAAADAPVSSSPAVADGSVYVGDWSGSLHAFDAASGDREWFLPVGSHVGSSPAVVDDTVYVVGDNSAVVAASTSGRVEWRFEGPRGDFNASSPAVVDESVLVCGDYPDPDAPDDRDESGALFRLDAA
ncbi:PQQ-binding-like beta-propeller repeat protein [Halorubellus sp. PRR65]|uniref:outer membrane protein assembly factor BamB family protein n=1 Tax=Halorubellus sp. PRR65 TaxID=3098148 RepID=UPI002B260022|nr:PQQ-binding-like beta-propeller repeat protein [Halorubellus sp. PRR65]